MSYFGASDYPAEVALGNVPGRAIMRAFGERESMGTTATGEDIWRGNELAPAPTSDVLIPTPPDVGEQMTVVSESALDTSAGPGVQTLRLEYLDDTGAHQSEDITMNGTTGVNTVATDIRFVNDMYALTVGSNGVAVDHIKVHAQSDSGLVYNMIAQGGNKSMVPHRMVPLGKALVLRSWHCAEAQGKRVAFRIRSTDMNGVLLPGVFCFKDVSYLFQGTSGALPLAEKVPALSIVKITGWPDATQGEGSCGWWGILVDD